MWNPFRRKKKPNIWSETPIKFYGSNLPHGLPIDQKIEFPEITEYLNAYAESCQDSNRLFYGVMVGEEDCPITIFEGKRSNLDDFHRKYEIMRMSLNTDMNSEAKLSPTGSILVPKVEIPTIDMGSIENKWFVFTEDCGKLEGQDTSEWNALSKIKTEFGVLYDEDFRELILHSVWDKLKISYPDACDRIVAQRIEPPPADQKYKWDDFESY